MIPTILMTEGVVIRLTARGGLNERQVIAEYQQIEAKVGFASFSTNGPGVGTGIGKRRQQKFRSRLAQGDFVELLFAVDGTIAFSARIVDFVSGAVPISCPWGADSVPTVFGGGLEVNRTWFRIDNIRPCLQGTSGLVFAGGSGGSGNTLQTVLAKSQFVFGYVH